MIIQNSAALMTQLAAGGGVKMDGNNLVTQGGAGTFLQKIGDLFRSNASIATRNDTLALAMSNMVRGQGPQNLAAAPPALAADGAERMTQVKAAKTTILTSLMQSKVDQAYPNQSPAIKQGIARHLAQWTMQNTTTNTHPCILRRTKP